MATLSLLSLEEVHAEKSRRRLRDYLRLTVWPVIEPSTTFIGGLNIDAICEHLEAVVKGQIRDLLITIAPRHTKSLCTSVAMPTWAWIDHPELRFLTGSYSGDLSTDHAVLSRRVIDSEFYRRHWGDRFQLQTDQNVKTNYENTKRGYRIATSINATTIGRGGDILLLDDPNNLQIIDSEKHRAEVIGFYRNVWSTRFNDPKTGRRITIMQRGHEEDLAGFMLETVSSLVHLNLPTEYEPTPFVDLKGHAAVLTGNVATESEKVKAEQTVRAEHPGFAVENKIQVSPIGWKDPRTEPGQLLWPERFGPAEIASAKESLLATGFATQHQQRPVALEGGMFKRAKLRVVTADQLPLNQAYAECRGWDPAATEPRPGADPDWTVGAKLRHYPTLGLFVVMDVVRGRFGPAEGDTVMLHTARADGPTCRQREELEGGSSGKKVIEAHVKLFAGLDFEGVSSGSSKPVRAKNFSVQVDHGNVWLLAGAWNQEYINELILFPNGRHDDQVDGSSTAFNELALGKAKPKGATWGR